MPMPFWCLAGGAVATLCWTAAQAAVASSAEVTSGTRLNPEISVILEGNAYYDGEEGDGDDLIAGAAGINEPHDHTAGDHAGEGIGFRLKPTEIVFSASVDPYFDAYAQLVVTPGGEADMEEAYLATRTLPAGLQVKAGRLLSGIGYHNEKHRHQWELIEQHLPYQHLLGAHGLMDTGVQLTLTPLTPIYTRFGVEVLQGKQEVVGRFDGEEVLAEAELGDALVERFGEPEAGPRLFTAFAKAAPSLGYSHELQAGLFGVLATDHQELHTEPAGHLLSGQYWVAGTDWVYAYDAPHQYGKGDFKLSAEYLYAVKDLEVAFHGGNPAAEGDDRTFREDGFYLQGRYGFAANWRAALRYDAVGVGMNEKAVGATGTAESWGASHRISAALTWTPTHFSRIQAQWSRSDIATATGREETSQYFLRLIASMGRHGAHDF